MESHEELSRKIDKGFIRIQKHVDTTISNVEDRLNEIIKSNDLRSEENFNNMIFQNQITVATVSDLSVNIQELSTRVDNITTLVEGMVGAQTPQDEVQPTVASVFDSLADPIGVQQPRGHRNARSNPTVGSEPVPVVLQGVTEPNRGNSVFSGVFGAPDLVEGPVFSSEIKEPDSNVTRRSNASARTSGSLRRAQNAERRNPDVVFLPQAL